MSGSIPETGFNLKMQFHGTSLSAFVRSKINNYSSPRPFTVCVAKWLVLVKFYNKWFIALFMGAFNKRGYATSSSLWSPELCLRLIIITDQLCNWAVDHSWIIVCFIVSPLLQRFVFFIPAFLSKRILGQLLQINT